MDELRTGYADTALTNGYEFTHGSGYLLPEYPFEVPAELAASQVGDHPVVIVGAGLAGLTAACALASYGIPAVLLDEDNTVGVQGRLLARHLLHAEVARDLPPPRHLRAHRPQGHPAERGAAPSPARTRSNPFDLRQQSGYNLSTQPPFINIQQFYIEGYLVDLHW